MVNERLSGLPSRLVPLPGLRESGEATRIGGDFERMINFAYILAVNADSTDSPRVEKQLWPKENQDETNHYY